jgi:hypothetical protein
MACADGIYVFCCGDAGWSILRDDTVIARGTNECASVESGIRKFVKLASVATSLHVRRDSGL